MQVKTIKSEVWEKGLRAQGCSAKEFTEILIGAGYAVHWLGDEECASPECIGRRSEEKTGDQSGEVVALR